MCSRVFGRATGGRRPLSPMSGRARQGRLWSWTFIALIFSSFFTGLVFYLQATTIANYTMEAFSATPSTAGFTVGVYAFGAIVFRLWSGRCMPVLGKRRLVCAGAVAYALLALAYLAANRFWVLLVVRFLHGGAFAVSNTALNTIASELIPEQRRGEGTAFLTTSPTLATAVGPLAGVLLLRSYSYRVVLWVCFFSALLAAVAVLAAGIPKDEPPAAECAVKRPSAILDASALPVSLVMIIMGMCYAAIITFMSAYADEIGLADGASLFFVVYAAGILVGRPAAGLLLDRRGDNAVMYPAISIFALGFLLFGSADSTAAFLCSAGLFAVGYGTFQSCGHALAVKYASPANIGLAIATFYICMDAGVGIGPSVCGLVQPLLGYRGMYRTLAGVAAAALVLYALLHGRTHGRLRAERSRGA